MDAKAGPPAAHRRGAAAEARLRPGAAPPDGRVLELRDLVLDHLHPRRRHHLAAARRQRGRRRRGRHRLAGRRRVLADRRAVHGAGRVRVSDRRAASTTGASILGGKGWGWATAWFNLGGLVFVTAAVNVGAYSLFVNFVGPMLGIDPTRPRDRSPDRRRRADLAVARAAQSLRHPRDDAADRLFRLADPRRRAGADRGDAARRARPSTSVGCSPSPTTAARRVAASGRRRAGSAR